MVLMMQGAVELGCAGYGGGVPAFRGKFPKGASLLTQAT